MSSELAQRLASITGADHVRAPREEELSDATRWAGLRGSAQLTVEPADAEQVAAIVRACYADGVAITSRGGGTGLAGGAVPDGGVVLSLRRLQRIRRLDAAWWRVEAEAGVRTAELQRRAAEAGLRFPPDPGAAETSTIGGNLATNAGGPHAFGHGVTGNWVLGVEAVLAPGELVRVGGPLRKDVAGYDLASLLVGSEGTLGVITAAWLRLVPPPVATGWVAVMVSGHDAVQAGIEAALVCGAVPAALELLDAPTLRCAGSTLPWPALRAHADGAQHLLLAAIEADDSASLAARMDLLREAWRHDDVGAGVEAVAAADAPALIAALQRWRDGVAGAVAARRGGKLSEDVVVPVDRVAELLAEVEAIAAAAGLEHATWGHAGDGNLHASFLLDPGDAVQRAAADRAAAQLFAAAAGLGGSISGEHGLGRLKSGQLGLQWAPAAVAAHRALKQALDPKDLFNSGRKLA